MPTDPTPTPGSPGYQKRKSRVPKSKKTRAEPEGDIYSCVISQTAERRVKRARPVWTLLFLVG
jgi:hypothetical protein